MTASCWQRFAIRIRWELLAMLLMAFANPPILADEPRWIKVEGLLRDRDGERPLARMAIAVSSNDGTVKEAVCVTDAKGRFEFEFSAAADQAKDKDSPSVPTCFVLPINDPNWTLVWCDPAQPRSPTSLVRLAGSREPAGWRFKDGRLWLYLESDSPGELETTVRDPDGRPLADSEVLVVPKRSAVEFNDRDRVRWRGKTDLQGQMRLRCFSNRYALHLLAPGLGCGLTAPTQVVADQITREIHFGSTEPPQANESAVGVAAASPEATLRVLDRDGQPARAFVRISEIIPDGIPIAMGSTDSHGEFRFTEFETTRNHAIVVSFAKSLPLPPLSVALSDEQLLASRSPMLTRSFFQYGSTVEVREQPQGYLRGHADFPVGLKREDYRLHVVAEGVFGDFDPTTGEFLVGPLSTGEVRLIWRHRGTEPRIDAENALLVANASVEFDVVTHVDVQPRPVREADLWSSRHGDWRPVSGRVRMSDGKTPAANARFLTFAPNAMQPVSAGWSDSLGRFTTNALRVHGQVGDTSTRNGLQGAVLMAWVPGQSARTVVPLTFEGDRPKELDIMLPLGHRVRGRVTIAGESALSIAAPITIALRHNGPDRFASLLGAQLTTNADGTFELFGLNPGRYSYQAALDDLWLSPSIEIDVTSDREDVALNIPAPGGTARLRFVGPDGSPWRRHIVEVDWPTGPLTSRLRPTSLTTDHDGELFLDGGLAGSIRVRLRDETDWHAVSIPKLASAAPEVQTISASLRNQ